MLALENEFDVEFPDRMLRARRLRERGRRSATPSKSWPARPPRERRDGAKPTFARRHPAHRRRGRGAGRGRGRSRRPLPARDRRRASSDGALSAYVPGVPGGGRRRARRRSPRRASSSLACLLRRRDGATRCTRSRSPASIAPRDRRAVLRRLPRRARRAAAADRVGDLRGRSRRRPALEHRGASTPDGDDVRLREAGADDLVRRSRRRPAHDAASQPGRPSAAIRCSCSPAAPRRRSSRRARWDSLGMRGTCSPGFVVRAQVTPRARPAGRRSPTSPRRRWCRSRTSCGRTCGSASPPPP